MLKRTMPIAAAVLLAFPAMTRAQTELPRETIEASRLSDTQAQAVAAFVAEHTDGLISGDAADLRRHRAAVLAPLSGQSVSVDFRIRLGEALAPAVEQMLASDDKARLLTALRIAGTLATPSASRLLEGSLDSDDAERRFMAASALRRTFRAVEEQRPAIAERRVRQLAERLSEALPSEPDAMVADSMSRALIEAASVTRDGFGEVREASYDGLLTGVSARLARAGATDGREMVIAARALEQARIAMTLRTDLPERRVREAAGLAGDSVAMLVRVSESIDPETRDHAIALAAAAEAVIFFARGQLDPARTPTATKLGDLLASGDRDAEFAAGAREQLIGPNGALTTAPFGFDPGRFGN